MEWHKTMGLISWLFLSDIWMLYIHASMKPLNTLNRNNNKIYKKKRKGNIICYNLDLIWKLFFLLFNIFISIPLTFLFCARKIMCVISNHHQPYNNLNDFYPIQTQKIRDTHVMMGEGNPTIGNTINVIKINVGNCWPLPYQGKIGIKIFFRIE